MYSKKHILVPLIWLIVIGLFAGAPFKVLEEDENHILLEFQLPNYTIDNITRNEKEVSRINADRAFLTGEEGFPILPYYADIVGIPLDGDIQLTLIDYEDKIEQNIALDFTDKRSFDGDQLNYSAFRTESSALRSYYPSELLTKNEPGYAVDRRFCGFSFYPFSYYNSTQSLRVIESARIRIDISGNKASSRVSGYERSYIDKAGDQFFLNNQTSSNWRKERELDYAGDCEIERNSDVDVVQLWVKEDGIYKITKQYLIDALREAAYEYDFQLSYDLDNIDPRKLEMSNKDGVIPIRFVGEADGSFDDGDYFEFWGEMNHGEEAYYDNYTDLNVYSLYLKDSTGSRLAVENGGLLVNESSGIIRPDAFEQTIHIEKQQIMDNLARGYSYNRNFFREDNFFWNRISAPNLEIFNFDLQYPRESSIRTFNAEVVLYGLTYAGTINPDLIPYDHHAIVRLNSALIDNDENGAIEYDDNHWIGQREKIFRNYRPLANSYLYHGTNSLYISMPGDTQSGSREVILLDYIDLTYWREFKTDTDYLKFTKPSNRPYGLYQFELDGFTSNDVGVYKVGVGFMENLQITPFSETGGAPYLVTFQDSVITDGLDYVAVTEEQKLLPDRIVPDYPSFLKSHSNVGELVMITINDFLEVEAVENFKQHWEDSGLIVKLVDVQDIYDEFSFGIKSPQGIKDFLRYAYNNWSYPHIKYAVFIGDGTYNENDNSSYEQYNLIPVKKVWTNHVGATACDGWYGSIIGDDDVPEIIISRIPARTPEDIENLYDKVISYKGLQETDSPWRGRITLTSGGSPGAGHDLFAQQEETIRKYGIPDDYFVTRVYAATVAPTPSSYYGGTFKLKDSISEGLSFLQFIGHGGGRIWADFNLLNFADIQNLTNDNYFFVSSLACYSSAFDSGGSCISEGLVLEKDKGAVGAFGFTGVGYVTFDLNFGMILAESLFNPQFNSVGEAYNYTLARYNAFETSTVGRDGLIRAFAYLGDPTLSMHKLQKTVDITTDKEFYTQGDTIRIEVNFPANVEKAVPLILDENEVALNYLFALPVFNGQFDFEYVIPANLSNQYIKVRISGLSPDNEFVANKTIAVAEGAINSVVTEPEQPDSDDPFSISALVYTDEQIDYYDCNVKVVEYYSYLTSINERIKEDFYVPMELDGDNGLLTVSDVTVDTLNYIPGYHVILTVRGHSSDDIIESAPYDFVISGPDLALNSLEVVVENDTPSFAVDVANYGNGITPTCELTVSYFNGSVYEVIESVDVNPLLSGETRNIIIPTNEYANGFINLRADINPNHVFPEFTYTNNYITTSSNCNFYNTDDSNQILTSPDGNLDIDIPNGFFGENGVLGLEYFSFKEPVRQPDIRPIIQKYGDDVITYSIDVYNAELADSLGYFLNGKTLKITSYFSETDSLTQAQKYDDKYRLFRWNEQFKKWFLSGGLVVPEENRVTYDIDRCGIYAMLRNEDTSAPSIEANVAEQEFTRGGYISSDGIVSFSFYDQNGIDVENYLPKVYLNGDEVDLGSISMAINSENINSVPLNYQLDLDAGNYVLKAECSDVNGNYQSLIINFKVNDEFDLIHLANYPNPIVAQAIEPVNDGRTRFTYILTAPADDVKIKVYTVSGRLVKTFKNLPKGVGYHEYPRTVYGWDCRDDEGFYLANGVYFYKIIAKQGGDKVEKIQKMAILR